MPRNFCFTVRYLQAMCHGRGDGAEPEWPPSPLRAYQALVAAAAASRNERERVQSGAAALRWLAALGAPTVVAAVGVKSDVKYRMYVPDNVADKVAASWSAGREATIADYRTEKDVRPTHLAGDDFPAVHFVWAVPDSDAATLADHAATLVAAARSVTHLGWGIDMAVGNAQVLDDDGVSQLDGERWRPAERGSVSLRVPQKGTFDALVSRHTAFLGRLGGGGFTPVPPLTVFDTVGYRRATDPESRPYAAFRILNVDPDGPNPSFDAARRATHVAAWVRNATGRVCADWPDLETFVHGHENGRQRGGGDGGDTRFMYLPLPTIETRGDRGQHVGAIRRVLVAAPPSCRTQVEFVRQRLPGQELHDTDVGTVGMLTAAPSDWVLEQYTGAGTAWSTVTPVILGGFDEGKERKAHRLLITAFEQAGFSRELVERAEIDWRAVGFRAGVELARRYAVPEAVHRFPRYHVLVRFPEAVRGPLAVGAGRYRGMGVFALHDRT